MNTTVVAVIKFFSIAALIVGLWALVISNDEHATTVCLLLYLIFRDIEMQAVAKMDKDHL